MINKAVQCVVDRLIEAVKAAVAKGEKLPWKKSWAIAKGFRNAATGRTYNGVNVLACMLFGNGETLFASYNQVKAAGGNVKAGSKGFPIIFSTKLEDKEKLDANGKAKTFWFQRYYTVFPLSCVEGANFPAKHTAEKVNDVRPIEEIDALVTALGVDVRPNGYGKAAYSSSLDCITLSPRTSFNDSVAYYQTLAHEVGHWAAKRVGVELDANFGSEDYSKEELTAEIFAAMFLAEFGLEPADNDSVAYLQGWLAKLGSNPDWLYLAAQNAAKRFHFVFPVEKGNEESGEKAA